MISTLFLQNLIRAVGLHSLSFCAKNECKSVYLIFYTRENQFPENVFTNTLKSICERKKDYINTGKSFSASLGLWVGSEAITPKPKFCQVCVRWSYGGHTVTLSMESLNRFKLSPQIFTADYRSLDKLANRLCLSKHPTNICLLYTGHIKATPLRSLCKPTLSMKYLSIWTTLQLLM